MDIGTSLSIRIISNGHTHTHTQQSRLFQPLRTNYQFVRYGETAYLLLHRTDDLQIPYAQT